MALREEIIAFDTGPANALLDDFLIVRRGLAFDEDGALGATGRVDSAALADSDARSLFRPPGAQIARPQFTSTPPPPASKSLSDEDGAATLGAFTVEFDRGRAEAGVRKRRPAGWSAAAAGETRTSCAGLPSGCK